MSDPSGIADSEAGLAEVEVRVMECLDRYDEEPTGAEYYLYASLLHVLMGLPVVRGASVGELRWLSEYSMQLTSLIVP